MCNSRHPMHPMHVRHPTLTMADPVQQKSEMWFCLVSVSALFTSEMVSENIFSLENMFSLWSSRLGGDNSPQCCHLFYGLTQNIQGDFLNPLWSHGIPPPDVGGSAINLPEHWRVRCMASNLHFQHLISRESHFEPFLKSHFLNITFSNRMFSL